MEDFSALSREQLIALLKQKEGDDVQPPPSKPTLVGKPCHFRPSRSNQKPCNDTSITEWGFCKRHSRTVQAKKARERWELENSQKEEEPEKEPVVYPPPPQTPTEVTPLPPTETVPETPVSTNIEKEVSQMAEKLENVDIDKEEEKKSKKKAAKTKVRPRIEMTTKRQRKKPVVKRKKIRPNYWGRYEDTDTHIIFDPLSKKAYGVQLPGGGVGALTPNHIAICNKNGWPYIPPVSSSEEEEYENTSSEDEDSYSSEEDSEDYEDYSSDEEYSSE